MSARAKKTKGFYSDKYRADELAKIHIAKKSLGLDDDTYRAVLLKLTGKSSAKDLDASERGKVLEYFKDQGFTGSKTRKGRPHNIDSSSVRAAQLKKIEALLADAGREWSYVSSSLLERMTGKQALEFCNNTDLRKIIAALAIDAKRRSAKVVEG